MSDNRVKIARDAIGGLNFRQLARRAEDVSSPDAEDSPGAAFLRSVRDATLEALEWRLQDSEDDLEDVLDRLRYDDAAPEIADGAVPIYTHSRMQTLVDLAAYHEDPTEIAGTGETDIVEMAGAALYIVAERLVYALLTEVEEAAQDAADEDENEEV